MGSPFHFEVIVSNHVKVFSSPREILERRFLHQRLSHFPSLNGQKSRSEERMRPKKFTFWEAVLLNRDVQ